jgi:hypothetical protein
MSFKEISEHTEVSINTALGRMRYALINMRKMIKEHAITWIACDRAYSTKTSVSGESVLRGLAASFSAIAMKFFGVVYNTGNRGPFKNTKQPNPLFHDPLYTSKELPS